MWIMVKKKELKRNIYSYSKIFEYIITTNVDIGNVFDGIDRLMYGGNNWGYDNIPALKHSVLNGAAFVYCFKSWIDVSEDDMRQRFAKTFCQGVENVKEVKDIFLSEVNNVWFVYNKSKAGIIEYKFFPEQINKHYVHGLIALEDGNYLKGMIMPFTSENQHIFQGSYISAIVYTSRPDKSDVIANGLDYCHTYDDTYLPLHIQKEDETAWSSWSKDLYVESLGSISEPTFGYGNYGIDKYKAELHKTYGLKGAKAVNKVKLTKVGILVNQDLTITDIKFNKKSTIVFWSDDTKTVVTLKDNDVADPEAAVAQAIVKKLYGGTSGFHNAVNKHVREEANKIRADISLTEKKLEKARKDPKKNKKKIATLIEKDDNLRTTLRTMGEKYYE